MHAEVRSYLERRYGRERAGEIPVLYGGSVTSASIERGDVSDVRNTHKARISAVER